LAGRHLQHISRRRRLERARSRKSCGVSPREDRSQSSYGLRSKRQRWDAQQRRGAVSSYDSTACVELQKSHICGPTAAVPGKVHQERPGGPCFIGYGVLEARHWRLGASPPPITSRRSPSRWSSRTRGCAGVMGPRCVTTLLRGVDSVQRLAENTTLLALARLANLVS
jgi:hypothetical protein